MLEANYLTRIEEVIDASGITSRIEESLSIGPRPRQLCVRTLFIGIMAALGDNRPGHLTRVHEALTGLSQYDQRRLGVLIEVNGLDHLLTYRQVEYTTHRVVVTLSNGAENGFLPGDMSTVVDALTEASIPALYKKSSTSLAVDWTDVESYANPVSAKELAAGALPSADPDASWGHRRGDNPGQSDEVFFGYYLSLATMVQDEGKSKVPEVVRRANLTTCSVDPVPAFVPVLRNLRASGVVIGDILADSGYAHRIANNWALPLRIMGANIVTDLHPSDRGCQGTFGGAILFNGNLYCPATPQALFSIGPLPRQASHQDTVENDEKSTELANYKISPITSDDQDGYYRASCPATQGRVRCPLKEKSMTLGFNCPEISQPPEHQPTCCTQATLTVPPSVNAKTRQKHDYPSAAHRLSYSRRTAVERSNSRIKDAATINISKGFCRLTGQVPLMLFLVCAIVVRNLAVIDAFEIHQQENSRRAAEGKAPLIRKKRRRSLTDLVTEVASSG